MKCLFRSRVIQSSAYSWDRHSNWMRVITLISSGWWCCCWMVGVTLNHSHPPHPSIHPFTHSWCGMECVSPTTASGLWWCPFLLNCGWMSSSLKCFLVFVSCTHPHPADRLQKCDSKTISRTEQMKSTKQNAEKDQKWPTATLWLHRLLLPLVVNISNQNRHWHIFVIYQRTKKLFQI